MYAALAAATDAALDLAAISPATLFHDVVLLADLVTKVHGACSLSYSLIALISFSRD